jgi:PST family polysaccharide transporter
VALATMSAGVVAILADIGVTTALVQLPAIDEKDLSTGFWVGVGAACAGTILGAAASGAVAEGFREPEMRALLIALLLALPITAIGKISDVLLQRRLAFGSLAAIEWLGALGGGLVGGVLAWKGAGPWALVGQSLATSVVGTAGRICAAPWFPGLTFSRESAKRWLGFGGSVLGLGLVNFAVRNVDNAIVGRSLGAGALGIYGQAYNLAMLPSGTVAGLVSRVMFPALSSIQDDLVRLRRGYLRMLRIVALLSFPMLTGLAATSELAVRVVYGERWMAVVPLLRVLAIVGLLESLNTSGVIFLARGRPNLLLLWGIAMFPIMAGAFVIGSRWGAVGVAWSYAIISPIVSLSPHIIANRLVGITTGRFARTLAPFAIASVAMGVLVNRVLALGLVGGMPPVVGFACIVAIGAAIYALLVFVIAGVASRGGEGVVSWVSGKNLSGA